MNETEQSVIQLIGKLPEDYSKSSKEEMDEFREYISRFSWTNAKTFHLINIF